MSEWSRVLETLLRERGSALFGYAYVLTGSVPQAEDLLQDALVRAFRSGRSSKGVDAAHIYVKRSITTAFIDSGRRSSVRPLASDSDPVDDVIAARAAQSDHAPEVAQRADLHAAILELPPRERACVVLHYLEDMSVARVAAELGIAEGSVKRYLSDAVGRLRVTCADVDFAPPATSAIPVTHHEGRTS